MESLTLQTFNNDFEVVVVEDGSEVTSKDVVDRFLSNLNIRYFTKENSGPGLTRNFGMREAKGDYFIILDSDCILPIQYLTEVDDTLTSNFTDVYGGADASHESFTAIQKAINYAMTSMLTTGGLRGSKNLKSKFQPRSFNMGLSKEAFNTTKGFSEQRFGEDIELIFRLWNANFESQFIEQAFVFHKRRTSWKSFYKQVFNFGAARPILNRLYSHTAKITYWFPSVFVLGFLFSIIAYVAGFKWLLVCYGLYFILILLNSWYKNNSIIVALLSVFASLLQFCGYGFGFVRSFFRLHILQRSVKNTFPRMFS